MRVTVLFDEGVSVAVAQAYLTAMLKALDEPVTSITLTSERVPTEPVPSKPPVKLAPSKVKIVDGEKNSYLNSSLPSHKVGKYDLGEIATVYVANLGTGAPSKAVMKALKLSETRVGELVKQARPLIIQLAKSVGDYDLLHPTIKNSA